MIQREETPDLNSVTVRLMGEEYVIRGPDGPEYLAEVATRVETRLREEQEANPKLTKVQLAVLVALRLADELSKLRREHEEILRALAEAR
ncbi:MAG: cell division protein ZapA [Firmicutes bacterium]|nr:cell division protein ZapA [Bacillota bacterium]